MLIPAMARTLTQGRLAARMARKQRRIPPLTVLSRGDFSEPLRDSTLKFRVVEIQIECLPAERFKSRR